MFSFCKSIRLYGQSRETMSKAAIKELFQKYLDERITPEEFASLYEQIQQGYDPAELDELLETAYSNPAYAASSQDHDTNAVFASLLARIEEQKSQLTPIRRIRYNRWMIAAAAAALLVMAGGIYLFRHEPKALQPLIAEKKKIILDVPPGNSGAILTLADGRQIVLDSTRNGALDKQGDARIVKQGGQLSYKTDEGANATELLYNTMTTPRGKQYQLVLSDGTKVWLNAASSIRFPAAFKGKERRVMVSGEAYFEVAQDKQMPFVVQLDKSQIEVLGTHFNVMDYNDERAVNTTLIEGAVKITAGTQQIVLTPGEQGRVDRSTGNLSSAPVDVEQAVAWTRGRLSLVDSDLPVLMRQISRWYDVDVRFQGNPPNVHIGGFIHRDVNLATLMDFLEENGVHYTFEGKTIIILP
jgi:ferric-dicitrate binding protein FerR (iron transport regulator)